MYYSEELVAYLEFSVCQEVLLMLFSISKFNTIQCSVYFYDLFLKKTEVETFKCFFLFSPVDAGILLYGTRVQSLQNVK